MTKEIIEFLEKLENWKESFETKKYDTKNNNEYTSQITTILKERNINGLLSFWEEKLNQNYFELAYPKYSKIVSRVIRNMQYKMVNFVFIIEKR